MDFRNRLVCLPLAKPFQPSVMFVGKARAYMSKALFRCSTLWQAPGLTHKHQTRLAILAKDKHSSLLRKFVNYRQKSFITLGPGHWWACAIKNYGSNFSRIIISQSICHCQSLPPLYCVCRQRWSLQELNPSLDSALNVMVDPQSCTKIIDQSGSTRQ